MREKEVVLNGDQQNSGSKSQTLT